MTYSLGIIAAHDRHGQFVDDSIFTGFEYDHCPDAGGLKTRTFIRVKILRGATELRKPQ